MKTQSWTFRTRTGWLKGEWDNEPDKMQWTDPGTGLPCLIVRNHGGALCGYVGVAEGHPIFGKDYDEADCEVHGGLTFSGFCVGSSSGKEQGICHVVEDGENDRVWWLGFDCAHAGDLSPAYHRSFDHDQYRNLEYVKSEVTSLAAQLAGNELASLFEVVLQVRT